MESTDTNSNGPLLENRTSGTAFQFSLLGYLTTIMVLSILLAAGGVRGLVVGTMFLGFLIATGHTLSEWILRPAEERRPLLSQVWFWIAFGCGFGVATVAGIAAQFNTSDFEHGKPSFVSIAFRAAVAMFCFYMAIRCWWHNRPLVAPKSNQAR